ncbi:hypothetical protein NDI44_11410 [Trichocoleus sp. DQ-A3]|uniref:hypothetical protein n=1 Tax=Cyanophyceae TaxID=3028117 RepID=UPI001685C1EE|nr:hypothetical protein [Coleofasciculus sp. FACHB-125]MBD1902703.1 hypothetical protein [Coleofasciculus sp. FACHB-125]
MNKPRRLGQSELELVHRLSHSQLGISPRIFLSKWEVTYNQFAVICHCTIGKTNNKVGSKAPSIYLKEFELSGTSATRLDEMLRSHFIEPAYPAKRRL